MKIIVTGSSGFIGKHLSKRLTDNVVFDNNEEEGGDIRNKKDVANASKGCDGIIHLAAISRVSDCESDPFKCVDININGTLNVIQSAVDNNIGWVGIVTTGEVEWIENNDVKSFKRINNVYGVSKLTGELLLDVYRDKTDLKSTVYRISSVVFGFGDNPNKVFPLFVKKALVNEDLKINDTLSEWDFIHVDDVVASILETVCINKEQDGCPKEVNIFSGVRLDLLTLAKIIHYLSDSSSTIYYEESSKGKINNDSFRRIIKDKKIPGGFIDQVKDVIAKYSDVVDNVD